MSKHLVRYLDAMESVIYSSALITAHTSSVNMDAESGNRMDICVRLKSVAHATEFPSGVLSE